MTRNWAEDQSDLTKELTLLELMLDEFFPGETHGSGWNDLVQWFLHTPVEMPAKEAFEKFLDAYGFNRDLFRDL